MHIAHLMVDGGKMSKSLGNLYTLDDLRHRGFSAMEVRYTLLSGHYRQPLNFTLHSLDAARHALTKLAKFEKSLREKAGASAVPKHDELVKQSDAGVFDDAWKALLDELNVPEALGCIFSAVNKTKINDLSVDVTKSAWLGLHFVLDAIGIELPVVKEEESTTVPDEIRALAEERWNAKQAKDWTRADELRKEIELKGWIVKDRKDGWDVMPH
jgi:cysteinyl-tRNA synthetase